jgi:alpha-2-macroglobulin
MSSDRARSSVRSLATAGTLSLAILAGSAQAPALRIVSASPTGELDRLADADQIRIVFSEPMLAVGTVPTNAAPPWIRLTPAAPGAFYWSGTRTLIFSPDPATPLPFASVFTVRIDAAAASAAGRVLGRPYEFTFSTPTVRLLGVEWYRKSGRFDSPAVLVLRFNQPVRPADVLAHAQVRLEPHAWEAPQLSPRARDHLRQTDPSGLERFDDKVAAVRRVTSAADPVLVRLAESWDEDRFPRAPDRVVLETTTAPPPDGWLTIALDDRLPGAQGPLTHAAQSTVAQLEPTFFVRRIWCEGVCGITGFGTPGYNTIALTRSAPLGAWASALAVTDITEPGKERSVVASERLDDLIAGQVTDHLATAQVGFEPQPPAHTWRLQLDRNLRAADGQTLDYTWVAFVEQMHFRPFIALGALDEAVWESSSGPLLPVTTRNVISINQWVAPVARTEVMARLLELNSKNPDKAPPGAELRRLALTPDVVQSDGLDIGPLLSAKGTGLVWAVTAPEELLPRHAAPPQTQHVVVNPSQAVRVQRRLVQVTNLGITVKESPRSTLVFVTTLDTGLPVHDARVAIVDTRNQTRWRGATDREGVALAPILAPHDASNPALSYMVTAEKDDDFAFVGSDWDIDVHRSFDYDFDESVGVLRGSIFTDRGVYKKMEEVHVKAVLRNDTPAGMRLLPADSPLDVIVRDSLGREADRRTVKANRWSSVEWAWRLPAGAALGQYRIEVSRAKARADDSDDRYVPTISGNFLVAAFRRPDFRVDVTLSSEPAVLGATIRGTMDAKYLFGGALGARPVRWWLAGEPVQKVPDAIREHYPESDYAIGYLPAKDGQASADASRTGKAEALDSAGRLDISWPTTPDKDFAQSYVLEGDVEGPSGQHIANRAALVVHPASIYIAMSRLPYFLDTKAVVNVGVATVDLAGKPVADTAVIVSLLREQWVSGDAKSYSGRVWTRREIPVGEWSLRTSSTATSLPVTARDGGSYILRAVASDSAGKRTRTELRFYALGQGASYWHSDGDVVQLTPERGTYKPGDTARILIHSPWPRATALVTAEREGIRSHRSVAVTSMQDAVDVPITAADVPNLYISVLLVKGRTSEPPGPDGADLGQPASRIGYTMLTVDDSSKRLRVDVTADRSEYRPRQPARVSVAVAAPDGKPARAEVTLWAMDYGLLSLTAYKTPDVLRHIYSPKSLQVMTGDSRQRLLSRQPVALPLGDDENTINTQASSLMFQGELPVSGMIQTAGAAAVEIRQDFRPLVFWLGSATTDASGRATTTVTLPDSLTTYRIMAVAGNRMSQFGFGERDIRVAKALTLLPAFPRFLGQGDRASFGAVVTNASKEAGTAVVTIQSLAPDTLQFPGTARQTLTLAAGASESVKFDGVAARGGSARVRMAVTLGGETDAFEMPLDVAALLRVETTAAYGDTVGTATETLALPAGVVPSAGGLTVELASSALVGLGEAARYLETYPYAFAEQTASRALALLLGSDLAGAFTFASVKPAEYRVAGTKALNDVYASQCVTGGFSLWGRCDSTSTYLTSYVLHTTKVAESLKVPIDRAAIDKALDYLERELGGPPTQVERWPVWGASQAYAVKVLAEFGRRPTAAIDRLVAVAERLPIFALSYLADALAASDDRGPRYQDIVRRVTNSLRIEADRAHVEEIDEAALVWLWTSDVRATSVVLDGLSRRKDDTTLAAPLVRWLLAARTNGRWATTHENAMALEALVSYYRTFESAVPRMTTTVKVGSATVGTATFNGRATTAHRVEMPMPALLQSLASTGPSTLSISRTGTGRVFYTARVQSSVPQPPDAVDRGFHVERRYQPYVKDGTSAASTSFGIGDLVRVTVTVTTRGEGRYLALSDPLPAGFEPIDAWFETTAQDLAREASRASGDDEGWPWWSRDGFDHVEKHDDRVLAFATRLPSGRHEFSYLVRATTAGTFAVGGARMEAMYAPEVEGRSQAATITVK